MKMFLQFHWYSEPLRVRTHELRSQWKTLLCLLVVDGVLLSPELLRSLQGVSWVSWLTSLEVELLKATLSNT